VAKPHVRKPLREPATGNRFTLYVPTLNDEVNNFQRLFEIADAVNGEDLDVFFDFSRCFFLRQNAVAFLGGLARLIQNRGGRFQFKWQTLQNKIRTNLQQNGFVDEFALMGSASDGNSIPFRCDKKKDKDALVQYLRDRWLVQNWIKVSPLLKDGIVGTVWEIYENAFEHGHSEIGLFSCGQHFPTLHELKLTIVDFGVGIPFNVRYFLKNSNLPADATLKWAFERGNTTKSGTPDAGPRGLGLDLLKKFVRVNKGHLALYSGQAYALIDEATERYSEWQSNFNGTVVNISLKCDERYYRFASEAAVQQPLF
jgi:hypothetical protein